MPRVPFTRPLENFTGNPLTEAGPDGTPVPITLRALALNALMTGAEKIEGAEKVRRWELARKIHAHDELDLTAEQVVLLKRLIDLTYGSPLLVAPAWALLDPPAPPPETPATPPEA